MKPMNYNEAKSRKHMRTPVSDVNLTVPNQALSIRDLVNRFTRGQAVEAGRQHYYDPEDVTEPDVTLDPAFDLSDVSEIRNEILESAKERKARAEAERKAQAEAEKAEFQEFKRQKAEKAKAGKENEPTGE